MTGPASSAWTHETLCGTKYQDARARVCISPSTQRIRPAATAGPHQGRFRTPSVLQPLALCTDLRMRARVRARVRKTGLTNQAVSPGTGAYGCRVIMLSTVPRRRMRPAAFELLAAVREVGVTFWPRS